MVAIGLFQQLEVVKRTRFGLFLGNAGESVLLPGKHAPRDAAVGDQLRVFVYHDSEDRPVATTQTPRATLDGVALMEVVDLSPHGAFVDWGLDKDLFVPHMEQHRLLVVGTRHVVHVRMDERTGRLIGSTRLGPFFDYDVGHLAPGREVDLLVHGFNDAGAQVVVDGRFSGLVYKTEMRDKLAVGAELRGYIVRVRDDNKIDIRLRKPGRMAELDAQDVILRALEESDDGFLGLHDKSPPDQIARQLDMSKKVFKAAIGGLLKSGAISLENDGVRWRATP